MSKSILCHVATPTGLSKRFALGKSWGYTSEVVDLTEEQIQELKHVHCSVIPCDFTKDAELKYYTETLKNVSDDVSRRKKELQQCESREKEIISKIAELTKKKP